ncbi:MAG: undecaprenyl/decaprenyl-phosphate alpha-N-acetylglucosaminyl 1-phosphate transferase [Chitinophagales bacterium]|nr:undecaprenyl/decaprenyl-phosphate alpha-N-acetylglucosaminyl 1-phosphate transferase [Chitinophagales bacterium]MDW8428083.1 MraY family glycosyltransferase [Chitinophagales bacterium]
MHAFSFSDVLFSVLFFTSAAFFSALINSLLYRFSRTLGGRSHKPRHLIRWSPHLKPSVGGFSFYILLLISLLVYTLFVNGEGRATSGPLQGLFLACTTGFVLGLADDAYDTIPLLKFSVQLLCGLILAWTGVGISLTGIPLVDLMLTLLWIVGMMNAINMLDNMDGIAATVCFFILSSIVIVLWIQGQPFHPYVLVALGLMGALAGFLPLNWKPARIYMGDTGSQLLGVCLAGIAIAVLWNDVSGRPQPPYLRYVLLPVVVFVVPLLDIGTVTLWRLAQWRSPFVGGRDHLSHHLVYLGLTERQAAFVLSGLSAGGMLMAAILMWNWQHISDIVSLAVFGMLLLLFLFTQYIYYLGKCKTKAAATDQKGTPVHLPATEH